MANKLYIGNLNYTVTSEQLEQLFAQVGSVINATVIADRQSGKSKGFGFVEMKSEEETKTAIERFNQKEFEGRRLIVSEARPQKPRESRDRY